MEQFLLCWGECKGDEVTEIGTLGLFLSVISLILSPAPCGFICLYLSVIHPSLCILSYLFVPESCHVFVPSCTFPCFCPILFCVPVPVIKSVLWPWKPRVQFRECSDWFWLVCGELWLAELNNGLTWYKAHGH